MSPHFTDDHLDIMTVPPSLWRHPSVAYVPPSRRQRAREIVRKAINDGKPLPLQVMLETMWEFRRLATEAKEAQDTVGEAAMLAKTLDAASRAAPYVHPKLSTEPVDGTDGEEGKMNSAWAVFNALKERSDEDVALAYQALVKGERPAVGPGPEEQRTDDDE